MPATWEPEPLVTIVTACLNAGQFLEKAVRSVLDQDYPRIEYIVMDGGSTDETHDILKDYEGALHWASAPDRGAADAINRGFAMGKGSILAFLNADDLYLPGAVSTAVEHLRSHQEAAGVYGNAWWIDESGSPIAPYPVRDFERGLMERECFICQPASFIRREPFENAGGLDPDLDLTFDYDFWLRLTRTYSLRRIDAPLAHSRMHRANKTLGQRDAVFRETFQVLRRNCGYVPFQWIYGYLCFRADSRDQFFEPFRPSVLRYLASLPAGLWTNRGAMARYIGEWATVMNWEAMRRRFN